MEVGEGSSDSDHVLSGVFMSCDGPACEKCVKIYVNDSLKAEVSTLNIWGTYSLSLHLPSLDNKLTVYNIKAVFEESNPSNATYYGYTPKGTQYAVSTTMYYGLKPSANSTVLTVEAQATDATTKNKELVIFFLLASFLFPTL